MNFDWCMNCDVGLPAPDCVIFFDMPVENATKVCLLFLTSLAILNCSQRGAYGEERYEKLEFQRQVQQQFRLLQARDESCLGEGEEGFTSPEWAIVNAEQTIEEIQGEVQQIVSRVIDRVKQRPIQSLWRRPLVNHK
jgi:dTMP kinase